MWAEEVYVGSGVGAAVLVETEHMGSNLGINHVCWRQWSRDSACAQRVHVGSSGGRDSGCWQWYGQRRCIWVAAGAETVQMGGERLHARRNGAETMNVGSSGGSDNACGMRQCMWAAVGGRGIGCGYRQCVWALVGADTRNMGRDNVGSCGGNDSERGQSLRMSSGAGAETVHLGSNEGRYSA